MRFDDRPNPTLAATVDGFLRACAGTNHSPETIRAYRTDLHQFVTWLQHENSFIQTAADVTTEDVLDYLGELAHRGLSGVSRWRKLPASVNAFATPSRSRRSPGT